MDYFRPPRARPRTPQQRARAPNPTAFHQSYNYQHRMRQPRPRTPFRPTAPLQSPLPISNDNLDFVMSRCIEAQKDARPTFDFYPVVNQSDMPC